MQQKSGDHWRPLGFFSRKLTDTESCYSTFDRELLAAHAAIKHFRHFCEGRAFQLWTDHKPIVTAISCVSAPISPRQQRYLAFISGFNEQILYLPSLKNVVADFFSRPNQTTTAVYQIINQCCCTSCCAYFHNNIKMGPSITKGLIV
jgi:hypothetical protein